jgi:histidinol-phosphate aminotransferase
MARTDADSKDSKDRIEPMHEHDDLAPRGHDDGPPVAATVADTQPRAPLRLHLSEGSIASPDSVVAIRAELGSVNRYPDPDCRALIDAIATHWHLAPGNVAVGNGSDEMILLCALALGDPGLPGVVSAGTFAGHRFALEVGHRGVREVPLLRGRVDVEGIIAALPGAGVAFLCTPHNPSGLALSRDELTRIAAAASRAAVPLVVDEAYMEFAPEGTASAAAMLPSSDRIVALRTFSKAYGLAGVRVGYALANDADAAMLRHAQRVLPFRVNRLGQAAALAALEDVGCIARVQREVVELREWFTMRLRELGFIALESAANFVCVEVADPAHYARRLVEDHGIAVRDTSDMGYPGHLRISLAAQAELQHVLAALKRVRAGSR